MCSLSKLEYSQNCLISISTSLYWLGICYTVGVDVFCICIWAALYANRENYVAVKWVNMWVHNSGFVLNVLRLLLFRCEMLSNWSRVHLWPVWQVLWVLFRKHIHTHEQNFSYICMYIFTYQITIHTYIHSIILMYIHINCMLLKWFVCLSVCLYVITSFL